MKVLVPPIRTRISDLAFTDHLLESALEVGLRHVARVLRPTNLGLCASLTLHYLHHDSVFVAQARLHDSPALFMPIAPQTHRHRPRGSASTVLTATAWLCP